MLKFKDIIPMHYWIPCFLCKIKKDDFKGRGKLEIGDNSSLFEKSKSTTDICPLCGGVGRLSIKPYKENLWEKDRKDYL